MFEYIFSLSLFLLSFLSHSFFLFFLFLCFLFNLFGSLSELKVLCLYPLYYFQVIKTLHLKVIISLEFIFFPELIEIE